MAGLGNSHLDDEIRPADNLFGYLSFDIPSFRHPYSCDDGTQKAKRKPPNPLVESAGVHNGCVSCAPNQMRSHRSVFPHKSATRHHLNVEESFCLKRNIKFVIFPPYSVPIAVILQRMKRRKKVIKCINHNTSKCI